MINYHQEDTPLRPRANQINQPMSEAPGGDRLRLTLQQVKTEDKKLNKKKPTKVCRPNQGMLRSYPSRASLYSHTLVSVHKG